MHTNITVSATGSAFDGCDRIKYPLEQTQIPLLLEKLYRGREIRWLPLKIALYGIHSDFLQTPASAVIINYFPSFSTLLTK